MAIFFMTAYTLLRAFGYLRTAMIDDKLRLYPRDPRAEPVERARIERALMSAGLLGRSIETTSAANSFRIGERFFELVRFDPPRPDAHCTIDLPDAIEAIDFLGGSNVQSPDCPGCGIVIESWERNAAPVTCDACDSVFEPWDADWHHSNAFGRITIDIRGIALGEAVPSSGLLDTLEGTSGVKWDYFYFVA
jgi:hypothetical protein